MRMLYLMHVSWGWIKQRPHFFAEKLSKDFDITIYGIESLRNRHFLNQDKTIHYKPLYIWGFMRSLAWKNKFLNWIYNTWVEFQIKDLSKYQYIWITNILFYNFIKDRLKDNQILIYDCMDDDLEFPHIKKDSALTQFYLSLEQRLVNRANFIFFSACYLSEKVKKRSPFNEKKLTILNNAIEFPETREIENIPSEIRLKLEQIDSTHPNMLYIGTISEWFDFNLVQEVLKQIPNLNLILIGPAEIDIPACKNIIYLGVIERKYIFKFMEKADALCMPFKVTELIRSVNPVKLYEYLYAGKPIIAPAYEETQQFAPYIYLYKNELELLQLCQTLSARELNSKCLHPVELSFIKSNTWDERARLIMNTLRTTKTLSR